VEEQRVREGWTLSGSACRLCVVRVAVLRSVSAEFSSASLQEDAENRAHLKSAFGEHLRPVSQSVPGS
jgi:hypothetical protein